MVVPDKPNETIQAIINKRQAKIEDTFSNNKRQDILARVEKQKEEFTQGMVRLVREKDCSAATRQIEHVDLEANFSQIKSDAKTKKTTAPISIGKQISILRGTISQPKSPVKETSLDLNNVINLQTTRV